jgi:polyphosphate kinase 2 (PPK2 family)
MGPEQIAQFADLLLGIELGAEIQEVQKRPQAEAHHEVLAVIEGQDAAGMFLGETGCQ